MTTTTLFNSAETTKPRTFGKGLFRSLPTFKEVVSADDERAAAQMFADDRALDLMLDRMANEAAALDRMERGLDA